MNSQNLQSPAEAIGELLKTTLKKDPHFYFFSPDETTSNRFSAVFDASPRAWNLKTLPQDLPQGPAGRVIELLSENVLFSTMTGHLMNREPAMMASYEAFYNIITSQVIQQLKFYAQIKTVSWQKPLPATNLLSTSTCWRQDHNGYTHQSPALISALLSHPSRLANCFFPVDAISAQAVYPFMLNSQNLVNLTTFNKTPQPIFLDSATAKNQLENGLALINSPADQSPDLIFATAGDIPTQEALSAIALLNRDLPDLKIRLINILALSHQAIGITDSPLSQSAFDQFFTKDKPIIANFHGYPADLANILRAYTNRPIFAHGFIEQGSTTTPQEMLAKNHASRYHLAITTANLHHRPDLVQKYQHLLALNHRYAVNNGIDLMP